MKHKHTEVLMALFAGVAVLVACLPEYPAAAEDLSVGQIVEKANQVAYYQGADGRARVSMAIKDAQGRTRQRELIILRKNMAPAEGLCCSDQKFYVYFQLPADVNKMTFMVWKHLDSDDDRWLYLPALDLVKRIAATEKRTSFAGSDFFYEDVSGRNINDDTHELVKTTESYYVLKNTPKRPETVEFSYYEMWVHRDTFVTVKAEFYDKKGEKYRSYQALKVDTAQGFPTVTKATMADLRTKSETAVEYSDVKYDIGLPDDIFSERYLRSAPRNFLR